MKVTFVDRQYVKKLGLHPRWQTTVDSIPHVGDYINMKNIEGARLLCCEIGNTFEVVRVIREYTGIFKDNEKIIILIASAPEANYDYLSTNIGEVS